MTTCSQKYCIAFRLALISIIAPYCFFYTHKINTKEKYKPICKGKDFLTKNMLICFFREMSSELESIEEAQVNVNIAHPQIPQDVSVGVSLLLAVSIYKQLEIVCIEESVWSYDANKS